MKAKKRIVLKDPFNDNQRWVTEIRNNEEVKYRELKSSFTEVQPDGDEVETVTYTRKFLTANSN